MNKPKLLFSILTIFFAALGLTGILPYNISLPVMFIFLGLALIVNAKESLDKGRKGDAAMFAGMAVLIYGITAYNLLSRL